MIASDSDDIELIRSAAAGDEAAFRCLYGRHGGRIHGYAYRMLRNPVLVEDVVQDCFLSLLERPNAFDPNRANLGTYLCGIARHFIWKILRHTTPLVALEAEEVAAESAEPDPEEALERREVADVVAAAVGALPPLQREALVLFEYEGLSLVEIAELSGVDQGAVSARLHRARARLRGRLAHLLRPESARVEGEIP